MNIDLSDKRALVCGSTKGIGLATARTLADLGASVTLIARDESALKEIVKTLAVKPGAGHEILVADFSKPEELDKVLEHYLAGSKKIQILVNNTGGPPGGPIINARPDEFENAFRQHLICNHILATRVIPGMKESGYGRIINIISTSVKIPLKGLGVSNTIRAAVANWSKTMANELAEFNITVNNVLPGATGTDRLSSLIEAKSKKTGKANDEVKNEMLAEIPMKRFAKPEEIASAVAFLASPAAAYITGINVPVDGGRTSSL